MPACKFITAGRTRGGRPLYYCTTHQYYTTDNTRPCTGRLVEEATKDLPTLELDIEEYPGGIGIWGTQPPIIDTTGTNRGPAFGVHVHARKEPGGKKQIDTTFRLVRLYRNGEHIIDIDAWSATSYSLTINAGLKPQLVTCPHCGTPHTDKGSLAVTPHRKHLCAHCRRSFLDDKTAVGNHLAILQMKLPEYYKNRRLVVPDREIRLDTTKHKIRVWASNPAILLTTPRPEEEGIHVHVYDENGKKIVDETFGSVTVDGTPLDPQAARILTAQLFYHQTTKPILHKLEKVTCPYCKDPIYYKGPQAFQPRRKHTCPHCKRTFYTRHSIIPNSLADLVKTKKPTR